MESDKEGGRKIIKKERKNKVIKEEKKRKLIKVRRKRRIIKKRWKRRGKRKERKMIKMEKERKAENEEEQKIIKKGRKKRIIKDWKNPVRMFNIKSEQMIVHYIFISVFLLYFFECGKKVKRAKNLYNCTYKFRIRQNTIVKYRINY